MAYLSCIVVCATTEEVVFHRRIHIHKCEWEETFGGLFDRTMAMSRSTVVKTEVSPSDLGTHHIVDLDTPTHVCQQVGCYVYTMSVTALLKDQNDKIVYGIYPFA